jgi:hypothetical protein
VPDFGTPRSCDEIRDAGVVGTNVIDDGGAARCAVDGLQCPLVHSAGCETGEIALATCVGLTWTVGCVAHDAAAP